MAEIKLQLPPVFDLAPVCTPGPDGRCSICADEGLPGRVLELRPDQMALVELPGGAQEVATDLVENVQVGEWLLVHLGFAIARWQNEP
jgi:hydrogenase assembly chaperone HypC/HupF